MRCDEEGRGASHWLHDARQRLSGDDTSLEELLAYLGERGPGVLLLGLSIPAVVPTPGVPAGMVFGTVLSIVALQMIAGRDHLYLPAWIGRRRLPRRTVDGVLRRVAPLLERIERRLAPRHRALVGARMVPALGLLVLAMGVLIALPIPFGNTIPGLAVMTLALGLIAGDGLAVAAGIGLSAVAGLVSVALIAAGYWMATGLLA